MGSTCQSKPQQYTINYDSQLTTTTFFEKPHIVALSDDELPPESCSPTKPTQERTLLQSCASKSPEQFCQTSQSQNDSIVISKMHISSEHFLKFKCANCTEQYQIERILGVGSYGTVYLVKHKLTGQYRAMKQVKKQHNTYSKRTLKEMELLSKLDHPFIIKALEVIQDESNYNMVIELLQGSDLQDDISNGKFNEEKACRIMTQLLLAVAHIHENDIVHRDIKPENILYQNKNGNEWIKLIDFGISTQIKKNKKLSVQMGSLYFMAPEIFQNDYGKQIDIWACGVTLYQMIYQKYPFVGKSEMETKTSIKTAKINFDKNISIELQSLIAKMLQVNPNKRITAYQALQEDWFQKFNSKYILNQTQVTRLLDYHSNNLFDELIFSLISFYCQNQDENGQSIQTFLALDQDQDGRISRNELLKVQPQSPELVDKLFQSLNKQQDDTISYREFLATITIPDKIKNRKYQKLLFQLMDYDQDGQISEKDFCQLVGRSHVYLWALLNNTDNDNITEEVFYNMFK